jgi:hypothetical protein
MDDFDKNSTPFAVDDGDVVEKSAEAETDPLLASVGKPRRRMDCVALWSRRCPVWISPNLFKTVLLVVVLLVAIVLFTRFPEAEEGAFMHAVARGAPWSRSVNAAAVEVSFWLQRATESTPTGTEVVLRVLSGRACSLETPCVLTLKTVVGVRSSIVDAFKLDQNGLSSLTVSTNSSVPLAVMVKVVELRFDAEENIFLLFLKNFNSDVASASVIIAAIVLISVYLLIILDLVVRTNRFFFFFFVC